MGIDGLTKAVKESKRPLVAIGGINEANIREIVGTGVDGIALVSAICHAVFPKQASRELLILMDTENQ